MRNKSGKRHKKSGGWGISFGNGLIRKKESRRSHKKRGGWNFGVTFWCTCSKLFRIHSNPHYTPSRTNLGPKHWAQIWVGNEWPNSSNVILKFKMNYHCDSDQCFCIDNGCILDNHIGESEIPLLNCSICPQCYRCINPGVEPIWSAGLAFDLRRCALCAAFVNRITYVKLHAECVLTLSDFIGAYNQNCWKLLLLFLFTCTFHSHSSHEPMLTKLTKPLH